MNNEMTKPVAWMLIDEINGDYMLERYPSGDYDWIPLYTHPVKELTDEERLDFTKAYFNIHPDAHLSEQFKIKLYELNEFARAILRKAQ